MIKATGIDFSFTNKKILTGVDFELGKNQILSLLGPSGCGKSTLLRILAGIYKPQNGEVFSPDPKNLGFVFQDPNLLPWLNLEENIQLPKKFERQIDPDWQNYLLQKCKLEHCTKLFPHELSGGMKMRTSLVRALGPRPQVLFCDEPFAALDEVTRFELGDLLLEIKKEMKFSCVFVTHSISESVYLSDAIYMMSANKKIISQKFLVSFAERNFQLRSDPSYIDIVQSVSEIIREQV